MNELMQSPQDDQLVKEYNRVKQMIQKKIGNEEGLKFANLSEAITIFMSNASKKEREIKMFADKLQFELNDLHRKK